MTDGGPNGANAFAQRLEEAGQEKYLLRLFVAGVTARAREALERIKALCEEHLAGRYELEVIDIYQQPELARTHQIVVTPTLVKVRPAPFRRLVGNLLGTEAVLRGLNIRPQG